MSIRTYAAVLIGIAALGCVTPRNFREPKSRPTYGTPYTLASKEVKLGVRVLGQEESDVAADLGVGVGIGGRAEVEANLAHAALGVVNVRGKYNFVDKKWWAMGASLGLLWVRPKIVWALPDETRQELRDIDLVGIPMALVFGSMPLDWLGVNLTLGYLHSDLFGTIRTETEFFDGSIGCRRLAIAPQLNFFAAKRVNIVLRAILPVLMYVRDEVESETVVEPGVTVGVRSAEWIRMDNPISRTQVLLGIETRFGRFTYVELFATFRGVLTRSDVVRIPVIPGIGAYWRF